jgi:hypothetical protein
MYARIIELETIIHINSLKNFPTTYLYYRFKKNDVIQKHSKNIVVDNLCNSMYAQLLSSPHESFDESVCTQK